MRLDIDGLEVIFPYDYVYPEQYEYMCDIKRAVDAQGHCLLEMPCGTGKTVALLAVIVAYIMRSRAQAAKAPTKRHRLIYCSRTVPEIEKALLELKRLIEYRIAQIPEHQAETLDLERSFLALGLSSRKNMCIHPVVSAEKSGRAVDGRCRSLTAPWVRERANPSFNRSATSGDIEDCHKSTELCPFYERLEASYPHPTAAKKEYEYEYEDEVIAHDNYDNTMAQQTEKKSITLGSGVYTIEELSEWGRQQGVCPYFVSRRAIEAADAVIYSYHYLLDPKIAEIVSKNMGCASIVVFDEAHNIDNVCIESMSVSLTRPVLHASSRCVQLLFDRIQEIRDRDAQKLTTEYDALVQGLHNASEKRDAGEILQNPVLPDSVLEEAVPGSIRRAEHFVAFLRRFIEYLKTRLKVLHVVAETPPSFLQHLREQTFIERKPLQFCAERLVSLVRTLEITNIEDFSQLNKVAVFGTLVATYAQGFMLVYEPYESDTSTVPNPVFHLACMDASIAIEPVFRRFPTVIITSGTLSPLDMYPKILQFTPVLARSYPMSLARSCFCPLVITRGSDQVSVSSKFEVRNDPAVVRSYGQILIEAARAVPDGVVCFFPSYLYMESIVAMWNDMGVLKQVWRYKLIFVETPDAGETTVALANYREACNNGRGAVLLSVARGKVSEGIDFTHRYGRAVIMFGMPYQYTESRILKARLEYLREEYQIRENDFLAFDAMRHAAQCIGRVLRGKSDYGVMILADRRYTRADKRNKLPQWVTAGMSEANANLSTDVAFSVARRFLRTMAQPLDLKTQLGVSLWSEEDVQRYQSQLVFQEKEQYQNGVE